MMMMLEPKIVMMKMKNKKKSKAKKGKEECDKYFFDNKVLPGANALEKNETKLIKIGDVTFTPNE